MAFAKWIYLGTALMCGSAVLSTAFQVKGMITEPPASFAEAPLPAPTVEPAEDVIQLASR